MSYPPSPAVPQPEYFVGLDLDSRAASGIYLRFVKRTRDRSASGRSRRFIFEFENEPENAGPWSRHPRQRRNSRATHIRDFHTNLNIILRLSLSLSLISLSYGAVRWPTSSGAPLHRTDFTNIQFSVNAATAQTGMAAIQAAMNSWNALPNTAIHFATPTVTNAGIASDGINVISFADTPEAIAAVGNALAVTTVAGFADGRITETDIILNPNIKYSTNLQAGTFDLQSVITHELGHALGANHATSLSSAMFWTTGQQSRIWSQLKPDDAAFAAEAYPAAGSAAAYGKLSGKATKDGAPLLGAGILATDPGSGIAIGGLTSITDGTYSLTVPAGNYQVYAAPVAPFTPAVVLYGIPTSSIDGSFKPAAAGGLATPSSFQVDASATVTADVAAIGGASALSFVEAGQVINGVATWRSTPIETQAGQAADVILFGPGLDASITEQNVKLIGPGLRLRAGTLRSNTGLKDASGLPALEFTLDIASRGTPASGSLLITKGTDGSLLAGGISIAPLKPSFTAASIVDAASSKGSGVAPGELVSLYGLAVGPDTAVNNNGFDPATRLLPARLGGVTVTFDGVAAPLLYASSGQLNLQVPYEVAAQSSTVVVVTNQGSPSDPVSVPVLTSQPGLFAGAGTQAIAVNQDGSINGPTAPAAKGTYVVFYATGAGMVNPPVPTGQAAPSSPLSFAQSVTVNIGGIDATVYQGGVLAPGFVGLMQVAAQVPSSAPSGSVPVILFVAGRSSPAVTIAVK